MHPPGVLDEPYQHLLSRVAVTGVAEHHGGSRSRSRARDTSCAPYARASVKQLTATTKGMRWCSK